VSFDESSVAIPVFSPDLVVQQDDIKNKIRNK